MDKTLALKAQQSKFHPQKPYKNSRCEVFACNLRTRQAETGESLVLMDSPANLISEFHASKRPCLKRSIWCS